MAIHNSNIHSAVPVIGTDDIDKSIRYYTEVLGFEFDFKYGDPVVYAGVHCDNTEIYFNYSPELALGIREQNLTPEVFIWVGDVNELFEEHSHKGAQVIEPVVDHPWKTRQYVIRDINGYHLKFSQAI